MMLGMLTYHQAIVQGELPSKAVLAGQHLCVCAYWRSVGPQGDMLQAAALGQ